MANTFVKSCVLIVLCTAVQAQPPAIDSKSYEAQASDVITTLRDNAQTDTRAAAIIDRLNSPQWQATLSRYRQQIFAQHHSEQSGQTGMDTDPPKAIGTGRVLVFISHAMPLSLVRTYAQAVSKLGNAKLVMRGFIGSATKVKPTLRFVSQVLRKDRLCEGPDCELFETEVLIDPIAFERFGINQVPAIAFDRQPLHEYCAWDGEGVREQTIVYGDVAISYAMERIHAIDPIPHYDEIRARLEGTPL